MLSIYRDRLEMANPGRLPNSVTVEGIKRGQRYARNQTLAYIMKDYGYVEYRGMLKHNGTEPDLIEDENSFTVRLWRQKSFPVLTEQNKINY